MNIISFKKKTEEEKDYYEKVTSTGYIYYFDFWKNYYLKNKLFWLFIWLSFLKCKITIKTKKNSFFFPITLEMDALIKNLISHTK